MGSEIAGNETMGSAQKLKYEKRDYLKTLPINLPFQIFFNLLIKPSRVQGLLSFPEVLLAVDSKFSKFLYVGWDKNSL
jgi:hypothetical protein